LDANGHPCGETGMKKAENLVFIKVFGLDLERIETY